MQSQTKKLSQRPNTKPNFIKKKKLIFTKNSKQSIESTRERQRRRR
jgi:hypothetical protein